MNLAALLDNLEMGGCHPGQVAPGVWVSWCPTCKLAGRRSLLEIRAPGTAACENAHGRYDHYEPAPDVSRAAA